MQCGWLGVFLRVAVDRAALFSWRGVLKVELKMDLARYEYICTGIPRQIVMVYRDGTSIWSWLGVKNDIFNMDLISCIGMELQYGVGLMFRMALLI